MPQGCSRQGEIWAVLSETRLGDLNIWFKSLSAKQWYQNQASDLPFVLLGPHLGLLTMTATHWATFTAMIPFRITCQPPDNGCWRTGPLPTAECQPCPAWPSASLVLPDSHASPAPISSAPDFFPLVFPFLGCTMAIIAKTGNYKPSAFIISPPELWLYKSVHMFSLLRRLYLLWETKYHIHNQEQ